jgi:hypothetical protein
MPEYELIVGNDRTRNREVEHILTLLKCVRDLVPESIKESNIPHIARATTYNIPPSRMKFVEEALEKQGLAVETFEVRQK